MAERTDREPAPGEHVDNEDRRVGTQDDGTTTGAKGTTGLGQTGADDHRGEHGPGTVDDPTKSKNEEGDLYSRDPENVIRYQHRDPEGRRGPTYEKNEGDNLSGDGGSYDPHNSLSHADSGNETE